MRLSARSDYLASITSSTNLSTYGNLIDEENNCYCINNSYMYM